jgi:ribonuclease BN (tRNA processing enzyme)
VIGYGPGVILQDGELTVAALRVDYPPVTERFAPKLTWAGKTVVFSAGTAPFPPLADFARGAGVLVHEALLPEGLDSIVRRTGNGSRLREHPVASHRFAADATGIAEAAVVGMLVPNHLIPADDPAFTEAHWRAAVLPVFGGAFVVGRDGLVISL